MELSPQLILNLGTIVVSVLGSFFGIKYKLDAVAAKVDALHTRLDEFEDDFHEMDKQVSLHNSHIKDLRDFKHQQVNGVSAFKMAKELLAEERADK